MCWVIASSSGDSSAPPPDGSAADHHGKTLAGSKSALPCHLLNTVMKGGAATHAKAKIIRKLVFLMGKMWQTLCIARRVSLASDVLKPAS